MRWFAEASAELVVTFNRARRIGVVALLSVAALGFDNVTVTALGTEG